jgi:hypothetical protein
LRLFGRHPQARHLLELPADAKERGVPLMIGWPLGAPSLPRTEHQRSNWRLAYKLRTRLALTTMRA